MKNLIQIIVVSLLCLDIGWHMTNTPGYRNMLRMENDKYKIEHAKYHIGDAFIPKKDCKCIPGVNMGYIANIYVCHQGRCSDCYSIDDGTVIYDIHWVEEDYYTDSMIDNTLNIFWMSELGLDRVKTKFKTVYEGTGGDHEGYKNIIQIPQEEGQF